MFPTCSLKNVVSQHLNLSLLEPAVLMSEWCSPPLSYLPQFLIMELILHKPRGLCNSKMQRDREEDKTLMKKNVLSSQKVSYCRPKNRERDGLGTFIFPCNRIRGWSQNTWKLYPEKQCETWPSGI